MPRQPRNLRPFRVRSAPACVKASQPRWFAHCPEAQFTHRVLRLPRNSNLAKPSRGRANGPVSATASASCYPLARREWIQHLPKFYACHKICTRPCESPAPATISILDLVKVLRPPRNETFARPCQWSRLRDRSETVPRPFRTRSETASVQASRPRWLAHFPEAQYTHGTNPGHRLLI